MSTLVFDIETISDIAPDYRAAVEKLAVAREWTIDRYAALCPPLARVACIAALEQPSGILQVFADTTLATGPLDATIEVESGDGGANRSAEVLPCEGEAALLEAFGRRLDLLLRNPNSRVVTYSGRGFDLPVLLHRSIAHRVGPGRRSIERLLNENRFRPQLHVDLLESVTAFGATGRWPLAAYAIGYGFRSPKDDMDGSQVSEAVAAGRLPEVLKYCAGDVIATAHVLARIENTDS